MTEKEVIITSKKECSMCYRKMHHGYKATATRNEKNKIKAYCCSDKCVQQHHSETTA